MSTGSSLYLRNRRRSPPSIRAGFYDLATADRVDAWAELHAATPPGWWVGRPSYHNERREWVMYAFDPSERAVVGIRQREWTAAADSEEAVVHEMARCLREIAAGRVPK